VSFDMHNVLELKEVLGSLSSFVFHSFKNYIWSNPSPHALFIDEMGRYIDNKRFKGQIKYAFQEIRKKNGVVIGAVQQPTSVIDSEIGSSIISNTATFLIFPNPSANQSEYMQTGENKVNLGLNDSEFDWVLNSPPEDRKVMLKRQGGQSVILNVDLKCLGEHLGLFSSNNDDVHLLEKLMCKKDFNIADEYLKIRSNKIN
jgi:type IV secretion system protein VirB4